MKKILVTGATGFVGSTLIPTLLQGNFLVVLALRRDVNEFDCSSIQKITVGDLDDTTDWTEALVDIDVVIHLAARAHIFRENELNSEAAFFRANAYGTERLVQQSIAAGVRHFVLLSSIGAVTTLSDQIVTEETECQPDTPYARSKLAAENTLKQQAENSDMTWTILRPTLVYGPKNPGNMERLLRLTQKSLPLPFASIANKRSLIFVDNLVDVIIQVIDHPNAVNQIFLVSDGEDLSTPQLMCLLADFLGVSHRLWPLPPHIHFNLWTFFGKSRCCLSIARVACNR